MSLYNIRMNVFITDKQTLDNSKWLATVANWTNYLGKTTYGASAIITPHAHARARGYVIGRGVYIIIVVVYCMYISLHFFLEPIFYLPKYSLSEVYFNRDRLLIEFNGLWYSLAARQVFAAIANPDSLLFG